MDPLDYMGQMERAHARTRVGWYIRSDHRYAFRTGQWALIKEVQWDAQRGRFQWLVEWPDGAQDLWPVRDPVADYKFSKIQIDV